MSPKNSLSPTTKMVIKYIQFSVGEMVVKTMKQKTKGLKLLIAFLIAAAALIVVLELGTPPAAGETITVDDTPGTGADFDSIQDAVDAADEGDTVQVMAGEYPESIVLDKKLILQGAKEGHSTIRGKAGKDAIVVNPDHVTITDFRIIGEGQARNGIRLESSRNILMNFTITNMRENGLYLHQSDVNTITNLTITSCGNGIIFQDSSCSDIANVTCSGNEHGIYLNDSTVNSFENILCTNNNQSGVLFVGTANVNSFVNLTCTHNYNGIMLGHPDLPGGPVGNSISFSNCSDNEWCGIQIDGTLYNFILRSNISNNTIGVSLRAYSKSHTIKYCNIYGNSQEGINATGLVYPPYVAVNNYWGSPTGPYHPELNPNGSGDTITDKVTFDPWLTSMIDIEERAPPTQPTNLTIHGAAAYDESTGVYFVEKYGNYTISVNAPSSTQDPGIAYVEFRECNSAWGSIQYINCRQWNMIGRDEDTTDGNYSIDWTVYDSAVNFHRPIRAEAYDMLGNVAYSETIIYQIPDGLWDLTITNVTFSNPSPNSNEAIEITVTVHQETIIEGNYENVILEVNYLHKWGFFEFIGKIEFGTISSEVDIFPDDPLLGPGDAVGTLQWITPKLSHGELKDIILHLAVDPDGHVKEVCKSNNYNDTIIQIISYSTAPPIITSVNIIDDNEEITLEVTCESNVMLEYVEYRIAGKKEWTELDYDYFNHWYVELTDTQLEPGTYTMEIRAYDGKYYSDTLFYTIEVENEKDGYFDFNQLLVLSIGIVAVVVLAGLVVAMKGKPKKEEKTRADQTHDVVPSQAAPPAQPLQQPLQSQSASPWSQPLQQTQPAQPYAQAPPPPSGPPAQGGLSWICPTCGTRVDGKYVFCTDCGHKRGN